MFNDKQNQVLAYELDSSRIKSRSKGNINLSYLEAFDVLETANRIFGYGNWSYSITSLEEVSQETNPNQNIVLCYKAVIVVTVHDMQHAKQVQREDVGFGTGIAKTLADAHEGAAKEAVTDAIKRSFRSFGNQFGNSLYDKSRNQNQPQIQQPQQYSQPSQQQIQQTPSQQQHPQQSHNPYDYSSLYNLGLTILEQGQNLIVMGDDMYNKRDSIKACGFRFDTPSKTWWKPIDQQQVA
ncbi:DNA repair protein Rad52 [Candidatus Sulfurimonas marisnigri]|uniref:DNA repair protein Rad52 n=1 Tax=Candidatus Sulfurimonas marisnigri TaxID=2740405 RepID=A0A7S7LYX6_9BACT|nr:Rad52/Rad22 family DNA repair protein [Candidatus Sulfurimonas marisnigri]QOY54024.1 DNA repair protein Rad52 [Candidatus Sulfurimonas marisnigri]